MKSIKNWDNKTWLSSKAYINSFNKYLVKHSNLNLNSKILDIGCGRGKILGNLSIKLKLKSNLIELILRSTKIETEKLFLKKLMLLTFLNLITIVLI